MEKGSCRQLNLLGVAAASSSKHMATCTCWRSDKYMIRMAAHMTCMKHLHSAQYLQIISGGESLPQAAGSVHADCLKKKITGSSGHGKAKDLLL